MQGRPCVGYREVSRDLTWRLLSAQPGEEPREGCYVQEQRGKAHCPGKEGRGLRATTVPHGAGGRRNVEKWGDQPTEGAASLPTPLGHCSSCGSSPPSPGHYLGHLPRDLGGFDLGACLQAL